MADAPNPFASLLPSPEGLDLQRRQQFLDLTSGQDYWSRVAGLSGLDFRKELINRGVGLTPEDRRAFNTQAILTRAQKSLADRVKTGEVDPLSAQAEVLKQAMSDFMSTGDYQAAQSLLPGLNQIYTYQGEIAKVKSATGRDDAAAARDRAGELKDLSAVNKENALLPGQIQDQAEKTALTREQQASQRAYQANQYAQADKAARDPAAKAEKPTQDNLKSEGFRARMANVEDILGKVGYNISGFNGAKEYALASSVYTSTHSSIVTLANKSLSPEAQQYYQAAADWIRAKLRKESGATISASEWDQEMKTYFPVPGDSPATIAQKKAAREEATRAMGLAAGPSKGALAPTEGEWSVVR